MRLYTTKRANFNELSGRRHGRYLGKAAALDWDGDRTCPSSGSGHHYYTHQVRLFGLIPWTLACRCGKWL